MPISVTTDDTEMLFIRQRVWDAKSVRATTTRS